MELKETLWIEINKAKLLNGFLKVIDVLRFSLHYDHTLKTARSGCEKVNRACVVVVGCHFDEITNICSFTCPKFPIENHDFKTCFLVALFISDSYELCVSSDSAVTHRPKFDYKSPAVDIEKLPFLLIGEGGGQ